MESSYAGFAPKNVMCKVPAITIKTTRANGDKLHYKCRSNLLGDSFKFLLCFKVQLRKSFLHL